MKIETHFKFSGEEFNSVLHYQLIATCVGGSQWGTGTIKRKIKEQFDDKEIEVIDKIYRKCSKWYLKSGTPEEYEMNSTELDIWRRLYAFCRSNLTCYC